jgi:hypothetical protein
MLRRSDGSWTKDEKRLQCRKGDQKGNERELNHPAARPPLFQAPEVFQGQTLTAESVRQTVSPKLVSLLYWIADAEGVTRITHRLCHLSVLRMDEPASQRVTSQPSRSQRVAFEVRAMRVKLDFIWPRSRMRMERCPHRRARSIDVTHRNHIRPFLTRWGCLPRWPHDANMAMPLVAAPLRVSNRSGFINCHDELTTGRCRERCVEGIISAAGAKCSPFGI